MMKRRIFAALLASALALSLTSCGGGNNGGASSTNPAGSSQPGASNSSGSGSQGDASEPIDASLTLNKTEVTLNKAGATFQLNWTVNPVVETVPRFTSSDETVARVDGQGKITAVAPGTAVITVEQLNITDAATGESLSATCTVTCDWKEETKPDASKPDAKPDASKPGGGSSSSGGGASSSGGSSSSSGSKVDLQTFYDATVGKYEFGFLELADKDILDLVYPGLSDIDAEQMLIYVVMISMNNGEFGLVQVKDSKDVDAVKAVFQARVDYMVGDGNGPGGAQYPMAMDQWENNSRIVSNGDYVMLIVHENCDDIVNEFNALF